MIDPTPEADPVAAPDGAAYVRLAQAGDLDAFNAIVDFHQRLVFNLCLRMLGSPAAAEDAAQDAFLSAWRNIRSFRGASLRAWLLRIAANSCTDELRRRARRPVGSLDAPPPGEDVPIEVADPGAGPEAEALRREQRRTVQAALLRLPHDQRLAVVMCDVQGFAYEEIAEAMRTSVGTVKSRIARGREKLRRDLLKAGEHPAGWERHTP
ncbi:MAG: sigma-70 family RNA polymerase sigma factor [Dehalococcoidia bacterium]